MITENIYEELALITIREVMEDGLKKHKPNGWLREPVDMHGHKSARHMLTALEKQSGRHNDSEDHFKLAFVRAFMALCVSTDA